MANALVRAVRRFVARPELFGGAPATGFTDLDARPVQQVRRMYNGQLGPLGRTRTRWYEADLEAAISAADQGIINPLASLMQAAKMDGVYAGILAARTLGLVRLRKNFLGDPKIVAAMQSGEASNADSPTSLFDTVMPSGELSRWIADGIELGVCVAEMVPIEGWTYPLFVRQDPRWLIYRWTENRWYYMTVAGPVAIEPGDGRWVLGCPGGRVNPWQGGIAPSIGRDFIDKLSAREFRASYNGKLAHPARVGKAPLGSDDAQQEALMNQLIAWGPNQAFTMPDGWDISLVESNGRGFECFRRTIEDCDRSMVITVSGQEVTVDGGSGFQNSDIFKSIRSDFIQSTGDWASQVLSTQALPVVIASIWGEAANDRGCTFAWDTTPPKDQNAEATSLVTAANAIKGIREALTGTNRSLDVGLLCERANIPVDVIEDEEIEVQLNADGSPASAVGPDGQVEDTALNGAQVASLVDVIVKVASKQLPRDAAKQILMRAFQLDEMEAEAMLGSAGTTFVIELVEPVAPVAKAEPEAAE